MCHGARVQRERILMEWSAPLQGMYGGCNIPQTQQQQQQQQEQEGRCAGESAASQESARDSSYQNPARGASAAQQGGSASGDDEATSSPSSRVHSSLSVQSLLVLLANSFCCARENFTHRGVLLS